MPDPFSLDQRAELEALREELRAELLAEVAEVLGERREPLPAMLTVAEACETFRVSRSQFDRWLADGRSGLKEVLVPVGRQWRVPPEEFRAWLLSRRGHTARPARDGRRVAI